MPIPKILAAAFAAMAVLPAAAQRFVDVASFPNTTVAGTFAVGGASQQRLAQTLVASNSGDLAGVFVPVACATGTLAVEIRDVAADGKPGPAVLASQSVPAATMDVLPMRFTFVAFSAPLYVYGGNAYSIVLSNSTGSCGMAQGTGDTYTDGKSFYQALPGTGWSAMAKDLPFQFVLKRPASPSHATGDFVDALQPYFDAADLFSIGGSSNTQLAQVISATVGGQVVGVYVNMACSTGNTIVELRNVAAGDVPGASVIASTTLPYPLATPAYQKMVYVPFTTALELEPSDKVAVVVRRALGDWGSCNVYLSAPGGPSYGGGRAFWRDGPKGAWSPTGSIPGTGDDLAFQLVLR